jgi:hypothetical protein
MRCSSIPGHCLSSPERIAAFAVIAGIEAAAVIISFALLGPFLGLRRRARERRLSATPR